MRIERKLDYFEEVIHREAQAKSLQMQRERDVLYKQGITTALAKKKEQLDASTQETIRQIKKENYKTISQAITSARIAFWDTQQSIKLTLYAEAQARLHDFMSSDDYAPYITSMVKKLTDENDFSEATKEDAPMGGFTLHNETHTKRLDFTFKTRLQEVMQNFQPYKAENPTLL